MEVRITNSILHYYVDLLRDRNQQETGTALHNIIRSMRISRNSKVCGEDLSNLDFGRIPLNEIIFSCNGTQPSNFDGCTFTEDNFRSGHSSIIFTVVLSDDNKYILSGDANGKAILWDMKDGLPKFNFYHADGINAAAISPKCSILVTSSLKRLYIWDAFDGSLIRVLEDNKSRIESVFFSQDGNFLISGDREHTSIVYDCRDWSITMSVQGKAEIVHGGECIESNITPDNKYLIAIVDDFSASVYDLENQGSIVFTTSNNCNGDGACSINKVGFLQNSLCFISSWNYVKIYDYVLQQELFSPEDYGHYLASTDQYLLCCDKRHCNAIIIDCITMKSIILNNQYGEIADGDLSYNGKYCAIVTDSGIVIVWNAFEGIELWKKEFKKQNSNDGLFFLDGYNLSFSRDGEYIVLTVYYSGNSESRVYVMKTSNNNIYFERKGGYASRLSCVKFSEQSLFITGGMDTNLLVWDMESVSVKSILRGHSSEITSMSFSDDTNHIISVASDGTIILWENDESDNHFKNYSTKYMYFLEYGLNNRVEFLCDNEFLALMDGGLYRGNTDSKNLNSLSINVYGSSTQHMEISSDRQICLIYTINDATIIDLNSKSYYTLLELDTEKNTIKSDRGLALHLSIRCCLLFQDGSHSAIILSNGICYFYKNENQLVTRTICVGDVENAILSRDGKFIAICSSNSVITTWNIERGTIVKTLAIPHDCYGLTFHPSGEYCITQDIDGTFQLWIINAFSNTEQKEANLKATYYHNDPISVFGCSFHKLSAKTDKVVKDIIRQFGGILE